MRGGVRAAVELSAILLDAVSRSALGPPRSVATGYRGGGLGRSDDQLAGNGHPVTGRDGRAGASRSRRRAIAVGRSANFSRFLRRLGNHRDRRRVFMVGVAALLRLPPTKSRLSHRPGLSRFGGQWFSGTARQGRAFNSLEDVSPPVPGSLGAGPLRAGSRRHEPRSRGLAFRFRAFDAHRRVVVHPRGTAPGFSVPRDGTCLEYATLQTRGRRFRAFPWRPPRIRSLDEERHGRRELGGSVIQPPARRPFEP